MQAITTVTATTKVGLELSMGGRLGRGHTGWVQRVRFICSYAHIVMARTTGWHAKGRQQLQAVRPGETQGRRDHRSHMRDPPSISWVRWVRGVLRTPLRVVVDGWAALGAMSDHRVSPHAALDRGRYIPVGVWPD